MNKAGKKKVCIKKSVMLSLTLHLQRLPLLLVNNLRGRSRIKYGMTSSWMGFTLIELLVVVLIIGILAAIALPQYQKAVKKATLAKHMDMARVLRNAEELFFLEHGTYTTNLNELPLTLPFTEDCTPSTSKAGITNAYTCGKTKFGIFQVNNPTNAQAGDDTIRYTLYFQDKKPFKKGDIVCYSKGTLAINACRSLGKGTEYPAEKESDWTHYVLD